MSYYDINSLLWQAFFAIAMFFSTFVSYLLPIIIFTRQNRAPLTIISNGEDIQQPHHWSDLGSNFYHASKHLEKLRWKHWLSYCNCISAGVFLGVCFLSLVPCVEDEFNDLIKDFPNLKNIFGFFALGQFTVICGLFLVLFLENLLSSCFQSSKHNHEVSPILYLDEESTEQQHETLNDDHLEEELLLNSDDGYIPNRFPPTISNNITNVARIPNQNGNVSNGHYHHHHHHHLDAGSLANRHDSMFSFFILMFATSVHSLFEGMALGLQSNLKTAIHLFIGIILHECLVAVALGLNAIRLQQNSIQMKTHIKFAIVFSMNIPLGNVLGILIGYTPGHIGRFISALFQGFAAGTFIHVTFFELIPEEFLFNRFNNKDEQLADVSRFLDNHPQYKYHEPNDTDRHALESNQLMASNDIYLHSHANSFSVCVQPSSMNSSSLKLRKISLLLLGFLIMALIAFIFSE